MTKRNSNPTDEEILEAMTKWGSSNSMTYFITNILRREGFRELKTTFVLRRLKKLEALGQVKRVKSVYATQLCWTVDGCNAAARDVGKAGFTVEDKQ
ncbi:hypothetical protein [Serratia marcescens]|uniref:hypothetical protein n=1 Tax=Serratia marcescens TaxID=615 RepID=UPI000AD2AE49|nr:hypothetical protein [Serratia marcescens]